MGLVARGAVGTPVRARIGTLAFRLLEQLRGCPPSRWALGLLVLGPAVELVLVLSGPHHLGHPGFTSRQPIPRINGRIVPFLLASE